MTLEEMVIQCHLDSLSWFPDEARDLTLHTFYTLLEAGELGKLVKKCGRGDLEFADPNVRMRMVEEAADVLTHLMCIFGILNVDPEKAYNIVRGKNIERWGQPNHEAAIQSLNGQDDRAGS